MNSGLSTIDLQPSSRSWCDFAKRACGRHCKSSNKKEPESMDRSGPYAFMKAGAGIY